MAPLETDAKTWRELPQQIATHFSLAELKDLCFQLDIRYDDLGENIGLQERTIALVEYIERHDRRQALIVVLKQLRPTVTWPEPPLRTRPATDLQKWATRRTKWSKQGWYLLSVGILLVAALLLMLPRPDAQSVVPMGDGFNIAVAQFTAFDETGQESVTPVSIAISEWLSTTLYENRGRLPDALRVEIRGPDTIGPVTGIYPEARHASAAEIANQHKATILIYGTVTGSENPYLLNVDFYVRHESFDFGSEIVGPERLGKPVAFNLPVTAASLTDVNASLQARTTVLQYVVTGLANVFILRYDRARLDFTDALDLPGWVPDEGHEVVYMLRGAAALEAYDALTNPEPLAIAELDFAEARRLEPQYARAYLGLGAVALEKAKIINPTTCNTRAIDPGSLVAAQGLYQTSLRAADQAPTAYIEAKAYFGLGQTHLLGWQFEVSNHWSGAQAQAYFEQVLQIYQQADSPPGLLILVARTHVQIGLLAGHNGDWDSMVREVRRAIDLLTSLNNTAANDWIARYWAMVAVAEVERGEFENARRAYQRALDIGDEQVQECEYKKWENALTQLGGT